MLNVHSGKSNIEMENGPFEDVFPIKDGDIPLLCEFTGRVYISVPFGAKNQGIVGCTPTNVPLWKSLYKPYMSL